MAGFDRFEARRRLTQKFTSPRNFVSTGNPPAGATRFVSRGVSPAQPARRTFTRPTGIDFNAGQTLQPLASPAIAQPAPLEENPLQPVEPLASPGRSFQLANRTVPQSDAQRQRSLLAGVAGGGGPNIAGFLPQGRTGGRKRFKSFRRF